MSVRIFGKVHAVEVKVAHFVDAGERDSNGQYDYYYEGDVYTFVDHGERLVVRVYIEDPSTGSVVGLSASQLSESLMASEAANQLRRHGVHTLLALGPSGTYEVWRD